MREHLGLTLVALCLVLVACDRQEAAIGPGTPMDSIEVGADGWSARLPRGWRAPDPSKSDYLEAPDGSAGVYFVQFEITDKDLASSVRLVHQVSLESLPDGLDVWQTLREEESNTGDQIDMVGEFYSPTLFYRISLRVVGVGRSVVKMTFHDYHCEDPRESAHTPRVWLDSLQLAIPRDK